MSNAARRHQLVILFADLSRSTAIAAGLEPEIYAELLGRLRGLYSATIGHHGGEIVRIDGDGALAIFGYPVAHGDAGRRAAEAALDLREAVRAFGAGGKPGASALELHCGIHGGIVLLRNGDLVRGRYEILGDATNVAARLCDAAAAGEILVSEETLGSDRYFYQIAATRLLPIAGHRNPVPALAIAARTDVPHRFAARTRAALTPFVGRRGERGAVQRWLAGGGGQILLLHGPPGIGKSRMLAEMASEAEANGWRIERGYCEAYLHARPLQPFLQIAAAVAPGPRDTATPLSADLLRMIVAAAQSSPLLLLLDDWQWADDASRDLLAALLSAARGMPGRIRILAASRGGDIGLGPEFVCETLALAPLPPAATQEAIVRLFSGVDPFTLARIEKASGGSPLLIEELCHAFASGRAAGDADPRGAWFDLSVQARFAELDEKDGEFVQLLAVAGQNVPLLLLARVQGRAIDPAMVERLQAADFLFAGESGATLRFKHGLTRDAVYAGIGLDTRRSLHGRIFDTLIERSREEGISEFLDALAFHGGLARPAEQAFPLTLQAGDAALALGALDRAQAHYRAAFRLAPALEDAGSRHKAYRALLNKFGLASIVDPAADQLPPIAEARDVMRAYNDRHGLIRSAYWLGAISYGVGLGKYSLICLREADDLAQQDADPRYRDQVALKLAQSLFAAGHYDEAAATFERMLPLLRRGGDTIDRTSAAYALACYGFLRADRGAFDAAEGLFGDSEALLGDERDPMNASLFSYRAATSMWRGDWRQGLAHAHHGLACSDRSRARYLSMKYRAQIAYATWKLSGDTDQVAQLEDVGRWFLAEGNSRQRASLLFGWLVDMHAALEDRTAARRAAREIVDRVRVGGDRLGEAMAWRALAQLEAAGSDRQRAEHYLRMAERSAAIRGSPREAAENLAARARLLDIAGETVAAAGAQAAAAAEFAAMGMARQAVPANPSNR